MVRRSTPANTAADRVIDELDLSMRRLREAMRDIPIRRGSFKRTHDNLARDVAQAAALMDAIRPILRGKN